MSVFDKKGALTEGQQDWLSERVKAAAAIEVGENFAEYDQRYTSEAYQRLHQTFDNFLQAIYAQAAERAPLPEADRQVHIEALTAALSGFYEAATASDDRRLEELLEADPEQALDPMTDLAEDILDLEDRLDQEDLEDGERLQAEQALHEMYAQAEIFRANVASGAWRNIAISFTPTTLKPLSVEERRAHADSVCKFKEKNQEVFNARSIAEKLVEEYNRQLVSYKVLVGLEAKYSDQEIIEHLRQVFPERAEAELRGEIATWREEIKGDHPAELTELQAYGKIMKFIYGENKLTALAFAGGAAMLGGLAPKMAEFLGEFGRTGSREAALLAGGFGVASSLGQVELDRRLSLFLNDRMYGQAGMSQELLSGIMQVSPEIFQKKDLAWVRQYADDTRDKIEQIAESSVTDIGARLARIIGLSAAMVTRLDNPALFAPCLVATAVNIGLAMRGDKEIGEAGWAVREATAEFTAVMDQAMEVRATRGQESTISKEITSRLEAARQKLANTMAKYRGAAGLTMPGVLVGNAMLLDTAKADFFADFAEASIYSMQLSQELSELVKQVSRTRQALRPVVEFANVVSEFGETGGELPTDWKLEFFDVKRKALQIDHLTINPGDLLVAVGQSGSGKSTLLEAIYGFSLERGAMFVDGIGNRELDKRAYRDQITLANQFFAIETKSLRENIISADLPVDETVLRQVVEEFGFDRILQRINSTRESTVADPASEIIFNKDFEPSGGERKMFALMSIDYRLRVKPDSLRMIVLDEPTSGVDALHKRDVFEVIKRWRRDYPDKTIIIVNHDEHLFDSLPDDTRILGFEKGKSLVQDETLGEAKKNTGTPFAQLFGAESKGK